MSIPQMKMKAQSHQQEQLKLVFFITGTKASSLQARLSWSRPFGSEQLRSATDASIADVVEFRSLINNEVLGVAFPINHGHQIMEKRDRCLKDDWFKGELESTMLSIQKIRCGKKIKKK